MTNQDKILIINAGSSSIKFQLFHFTTINQVPVFTILGKGLVERIAIKNSNFIIEITKDHDFIKHEKLSAIANHNLGAQIIIDALIKYQLINDFSEIKGIGHRLVHGAQKFKTSTIIDQNVIAGIEACIPLAPLHNPPALKAITAFQKLMAQVKHVGVFDTSFHTSIPETNFLYAVPYRWYQDYQVRRYGFHGISYRYILAKLTTILTKPVGQINAIVCHLGNGASICAIKNGVSYNTSMGLTPLDGLMMGTRSGIIDPSIHGYMCDVAKNMNITSLTNDLNKAAGLLGISEHSSDLRDIISASNDPNHPQKQQSQLAIKMFIQRIANYIIQYANDLANEIDALVFTAGIGENSALIRQLVIAEIKVLTVALNDQQNNAKYEDYLEISSKASTIPIYKIKTNEEIMICQDTYDLLVNH